MTTLEPKHDITIVGLVDLLDRIMRLPMDPDVAADLKSARRDISATIAYASKSLRASLPNIPEVDHG